jgi:membrane associated rhomboid family serine protease
MGQLVPLYSVVHLLVNCYSLHNIGPVIERQFGKEQFMVGPFTTSCIQCTQYP